jgi:hypothetical protein
MKPFPHPGATEEVRDPVPLVVRLVPRKPLYLLCFGARAEQCLVRPFRDTWQHIPTAPRRRMLDYWHGAVPWRGLPAPRIAVWPDWPGRKNVAGECGCLGHELRFWEAVVETYTPSDLTLAIAHELAHVYQYASGREPGQRSKSSVEKEAWAIARSWGFPLPPARQEASPPTAHDLARAIRAWRKRNPNAAWCGQLFWQMGWFFSDIVRTPQFARMWEKAAGQMGPAVEHPPGQ